MLSLQQDVVRGQNITPVSGSLSGGGEALRLTAPARAEVVILVDPAATGGQFSAGLMTLPPGGAWPAHRLLERDELVFFHKGQGRLTVDGRPLIVVPGVSRLIPRGAVQHLRNTGTGVLQFLWTAPAGHEQFLRELAQVTDPGALPALWQRYGVEWPAESGEAHVSPPGRRHRRHRGRGRGGRARHADAVPISALPAAVAQPAAPSAPPGVVGGRGVPSPGGAGRRRRRRRGGRGRGQSAAPAASAPSAAPTSQSAQAGETPRAAPVGRNSDRGPRGQRPGPESKGRADQRRGRHRRGHVKEVYMGGKWIRVVGEGPVISTGQQPPAPEE